MIIFFSILRSYLRGSTFANLIAEFLKIAVLILLGGGVVKNVI